MNPKLSRFWHAVMMIGGLLAQFAPELTGLAAYLQHDGAKGTAAVWAIKALGWLALLGANWSHIRGRLVAMGVVDAAPEAATKPEKAAPVIDLPVSKGQP